MTTVNRICFELSDIVAIELECKKCKTITCYPKGDWTPASLKCPNSGCGVPLITGYANDPSEELRALDEFVTGLRRVLNHSKEFAFSLRLEFNQP